ncbi:hypothetical protein CBM2634_A40003 [Cupriavidus taiwanensis]|uniref:Uncharacterized protein n=1 Tax=Cupriavidus taiwanensis TaxID=164546 RepID=A0A375J237_9BURK|nr:hypothetical protein CBM2634_A40003 [Cupriavidus taiwanensis]
MGMQLSGKTTEQFIENCSQLYMGL